MFGSRLQQVEHVGYALMLADRAERARGALVRRQAVGGAERGHARHDAPPAGCPLGALAPELRSPTRCSPLSGASSSSSTTAGISHGNLDGLRMLVDETTNIAFDDFTSAVATGEEYWCNRDDAAAARLDTAQLVGNDRADRRRWSKTLGKDRVGQVDPVRSTGGAAVGD